MSTSTPPDGGTAGTQSGPSVANGGCPYCPESDFDGIANHLRWNCDGVKRMRREEMGLPENGYNNLKARNNV